MANNGVVADDGLDLPGGTVPTSSVPRGCGRFAIEAADRQAKQSDGELPPQAMVYFVMALALFGGDDYEGIAARLTRTLTSWGCWDDS